MRTLQIPLVLLLPVGASWGVGAFASEPLDVRLVAEGGSSLVPGSALLLAVVSALAIAAERSAR